MQQPSIENQESRQYQILLRLSIGLALALLAMPICLRFDLLVATKIDYFAVPGDLRTILSCSEVFGHIYGVFFILTAIWFASPDNRRKITSIAYLLVASCCLVSLLKNSILRTRPRGGQASQFDTVWETFRGLNPAITEFDFSRLGQSNFQSYPSGHATTAMILGIGLAIVFPRARYLFLLFAGFACAQRVGYQAHYLSDVCAGAIIAMVLFAGFLITPFGKNRMLGTTSVFPVVDEWPQDSLVMNRSQAA